MVTSDELYEKGSEVLNRFRSGSPASPSQGPTSYDMVPGQRRLVAEWAFVAHLTGFEISYVYHIPLLIATHQIKKLGG